MLSASNANAVRAFSPVAAFAGLMLFNEAAKGSDNERLSL